MMIIVVHHELKRKSHDGLIKTIESIETKTTHDQQVPIHDSDAQNRCQNTMISIYSILFLAHEL